MWRGGRRDLKENRLAWEGNEFHLSSSFAFVSLNFFFFFFNKFLSGPTLDYEEGKQKLFSAKVKSFLGAVRYDASLFHTFFFLFPYISLFLSHKFIPNCNSPSCRHLPSRCISLKWFISLFPLFCAEHTFSVIRNCTIFFFLITEKKKLNIGRRRPPFLVLSKICS